MASPKPEILFVYNASTGAPLGGQAGSMTFSSYVKDDGTAVAQPAITQVAVGIYSFTPVFADVTHGIAYILNTGTGASPQYYARYMRVEDYNADDVPIIEQLVGGNWEIKNNQLFLYDVDNVTPKKQFNLFDIAGNPANTAVAKRVAF